jgi:hypothetical protein
MEGPGQNWKNVSGVNAESMIKNLEVELMERYEDDTLREWVTENMPEWVVSENTKYTSDLRRISDNWGNICEKLMVPKRSILRVRNIGVTSEEDRNFTLIMTVCEYLTRLGYVVKFYQDFTPCKKCSSIMIGRRIQETMWGVGNFSTVCNDCIEK